MRCFTTFFGPLVRSGRRSFDDPAGFPPLRVVEAHHLMTSTEIRQKLCTLAQKAAPGPNFMYVTLMGWHLAGWAGAAAMTIPVACARNHPLAAAVRAYE